MNISKKSIAHSVLEHHFNKRINKEMELMKNSKENRTYIIKRRNRLTKKFLLMLDGRDHIKSLNYLLNTISVVYEKISFGEVDEEKQIETIEHYFNVIDIHLKNDKKKLMNFVINQK